MGLEDGTMRGMLDRHKCKGADCYANTDLRSSRLLTWVQLKVTNESIK